jgi:glucose-1-phosphate thymidylyltransferase
LINAWLAQGGEALGVRAGEAYVDVGTLEGYRSAMQLLRPDPPGAARPTLVA